MLNLYAVVCDFRAWQKTGRNRAGHGCFILPQGRRALVATAILLTVIVGQSVNAVGQSTPCYGACQVQPSCSAGSTTSVTGTVYAPNGTDPLPNVLVYVPSVAPDPLAAGVQCLQAGQPASGLPVTTTNSAVDGTFTLNNVPVGSNIPIVIQAGKWRLQSTISTVTACTNTAVPAASTTFPSTQTQGDIPQIAVATGSVDALECVLRKVGIADPEFTAPSGGGRVHLYSGSLSPGAQYYVPTGTSVAAPLPSETTLMSSPTTMSNYDVLMFPCQGGAGSQATSAYQQNLINWAGLGGRVFATHYSYAWLYNDPPFSTTANWNPDVGDPPDGAATINTAITSGATLAQWLQKVGASTTLGQINVSTLRVDQTGVVAPTQAWLTLNKSFTGTNSAHTVVPNAIMQFTFDTPVGAAPAQQCGRVLFNEYHVETASVTSSNNTFPKECPGGAMTPQEKLLEYSLFDLSTFVTPVLIPQTITFAPLPSPVTYGVSPLTLVATGGKSGNPVTFTVTGPATISGNLLTITGGGTVVVTANQAGNASYDPAAPVSQTVIVNPATPVVSSVTAGPSPIFLLNNVTLTATVSSPLSTPTGPVLFYSGSTQVGYATLVGGVATTTVGSLPVGVYSISAVYTGDSNFTGANGGAAPETVQDFSLTTSGTTTQTVDHGGTATYTFIVTPIGGSLTPSPINFSVIGYRGESVVTFSPATVPAASGMTVVTLTIQVATYPTNSRNDTTRPERAAGVVALALLLLPFSRRMRRAGKQMRHLLTLLLLVSSIFGAMGLMGCGAGWPTQTRPLVVSATAGALIHTSNLTIIEQ